jgi:hypothetical protein
MEGYFMSDESENSWKDGVVTFVKELSSILLERQRKVTETPSG